MSIVSECSEASFAGSFSDMSQPLLSALSDHVAADETTASTTGDVACEVHALDAQDGGVVRDQDAFAAAPRIFNKRINKSGNGNAAQPLHERTIDVWVGTGSDFCPTTATVAYDSNAVLGEGSFGSVFLGHFAAGAHDLNRAADAAEFPVAVKTCEHKNSTTNAHHEAACTAAVLHPNVVKCYGVSQRVGKYASLVLEYAAGGTLQGVVDRTEKLSYAVAMSYVKEMVSALVAVHAAGLVHCDLKLENILLRDDGSVAIADFGCARWAGIVPKSVELGTPRYMSPESITAPETFDPKRDIWALGCCIAALVAGVRSMPWEHTHLHHAVAVMYRVAYSPESKELPFTRATVCSLPPPFRRIVVDCLRHDPVKRPTAAQLHESLCDSRFDTTSAF